MERNDDYTSGNLLDYLHHQKYFKVLGLDLSRLANMNIPEQINFTEKLEEDDGAKGVFFWLKSRKKLF